METLCLACSLCWIIIFPCLSTSHQPPPHLPLLDWAVFSFLNQWACCWKIILLLPTPRLWDRVRMPFDLPPQCGLLSWAYKISLGFVMGVSPSPPPFLCLFRNANALAPSHVNNTCCTAYMSKVLPLFLSIQHFSCKYANVDFCTNS